jgi:phage shock protein A
MFKQIVTLIRGQAYENTERVLDAHALPLLRQQIRDCAEAVNAARRALAFAIAQNESDIAQTKKLSAKIVDLENRTISAMEQGKDDLAKEAAETIAVLETERDASVEAQNNFAAEAARLKRVVAVSESRLRELERGQRLASVTDKTQRLRETAPGATLNALKDAQATLDRLRTRQKHVDAAAIVLEEMENAKNPSTLAERMAEVGCGAPTKTRSEDVLKRLRNRIQPQV